MKAIVHEKSGRPNYYIVLDYKDDTGKRQRKWISTDIPIKGNNKRRAEEKRKEVLAEYEKSSVDLSRDIMFVDFMAMWLETLKHSIAPTTYEGYSLIINAHIMPYFKPKKLRVKDLMPANIQQYMNDKQEKVSPNTVIKHLRVISKCLNDAVEQNIIAFNPAKQIKMPKQIKYSGAKYYNEKQIEQLLEYSKSDPLEIVILLTVFYGLRRSEVLGLKWDAIDFENNTITIKHTVTRFGKEIHKTDSTKNESSYAVLPLPNMIKSRLEEWRRRQLQNKLLQPNDYADSDYICTRFDGNLILPNYVSQHFQILLKKSGLSHIRFHDLRHSSASYLKYLGFDLKDIQTWLRHGDIQTTLNIYTHLDMEAKRQIAERLNNKFQNFG